MVSTGAISPDVGKHPKVLYVHEANLRSVDEKHKNRSFEEGHECKDSSNDISNQERMKIEENVSTWKKVKSKERKNINQAMIFKPVETYNRFDILENEENVDNVIPEQKCDPAYMKKQSLSNKTKAKKMTSPFEFTNFDQKEKNAEVRFGMNLTFTSFLLTQIRKNNGEDKWFRCSKCWINHTPYPKFCRWARSSRKKKDDSFSSHISDELKQEIEKHIERIERNEKSWEDLIMDAVSLEKELSPEFPDIILDSKIPKLKGGAKVEKIKKFSSKTDQFNTVLNCLRSCKVFEQFSNHGKCFVGNNCSFCLLRSLIFKINSTKGRQAIKPVELESQENSENLQSSSLLLEHVLENITLSYAPFHKAIHPVWMCRVCNEPIFREEGNFIQLNEEADNRRFKCLLKSKLEDIQRSHIRSSFCCEAYGLDVHKIFLGEEQKICMFKTSSMDLNLLENVEIGREIWNCVSGTDYVGNSFKST